MLNNSKIHLWSYALIIYGILVRLGLYLASTSFWLDETALVMNIANRSFAELLQPLGAGQLAPFGFLASVKAVTLFMGQSELGYRFVPFFISCVSILLFYRLTLHFKDEKLRFFALFFFVISESLINYSAECKQYAFDVFFVIIGLILMVRSQKTNHSFVALLLLFIFGLIAVWFSHAMMFFLGAIGIFLFFEFAKNKQYKKLFFIGFSGVAWLAMFYFSVMIYMGKGLGQTNMFTFWDSYCLPLPISTAAVRWYLESLPQVFANPGGFFFVGLAGFLFVAGAVTFWIEDKKKFWLFLLPIFLTLLASLLKKYPIFQRLILFWTPVLYIMMAAGLSSLWQASRSKAIPAMLLIILSASPVLKSVNAMISPSQYPEVKQVLADLQENRQAGDAVYIYYKAALSVEFYGPQYNLKPDDYTVGIDSRNDWWAYLRELDQLQGSGRTWFYFTHVCTWKGVNEEKLYLNYLDTFGEQLQSFKRDGASLYLYDLGERENSEIVPLHQ